MSWFKQKVSNETEVNLRKELDTVKCELIDAKTDLAVSKGAYDSLARQFDAYKQSVVSDQRSAAVGIDFEAMNAFSIERALTKDIHQMPCTIIGYFIETGTEKGKVLKEWYIHCNDEMHSELVTLFAEYTDSKYSPKRKVPK